MLHPNEVAGIEDNFIVRQSIERVFSNGILQNPVLFSEKILEMKNLIS